MSRQDAKRQKLIDNKGIFSGGYVDNVSQVDMAPQFSPYLRNARLDGQSIIIRPGHDLFVTVDTSTEYPRGIGSYLRADPTNNRLVVRQNVDATHKLVSVTNAAVATNISTGSYIASSNKMRFVNVADLLYCMNGSDALGRLNGTTYDTPASIAKGFVITSNTGKFTVGETLTGGTSGATAKMLFQNGGIGGSLFISVTTGTFVAGETITGGTSAFTAVISSISEFTPAFAVVFNSSMFVSGWTTMPNVVFKSVGDLYHVFIDTGADQFTFQEQMTGLSANSEALFYFTTNTISVTGWQDITDTAGTITYTTRPLIVKEGAANHDCIVEVGTKTYYLSSSNTINMIARGTSINGFEVMELSDRPYAGITKLMGSLAKDQTNAFAVYYPNEMLIKRHLYSQGSTFADIVVIYDTIHDAFLIDEQKYFTDGTYFEGYNYTTSAIENKVYRDEYSQTDEDQPIPFEYWTKEHYLGDATGKKIIRESRSMVDINELAGLEQTIWIDGGLADEKTIDADNIPLITGGIGTYEIGTSEIGVEGEYGDEEYYEVPILRTKGNLNVKCRKIQWRYTNNTQAGKARLKTIDVKVEMLPELTTNLTQ